MPPVFVHVHYLHTSQVLKSVDINIYNKVNCDHELFAVLQSNSD